MPAAADINTRIGSRVRLLREQQRFSLEALAERCGVSRSNISLIERGESSPTATVLDKLAWGLGVTVSSFFEDADSGAGACSPLSRPPEQAVWTDPQSGYTRRDLSAPAPNAPLRLVEVRFPAGRKVTYETGAREHPIHQQVWMLEGAMELTVGSEQWRLAEGDCLSMSLDRPITFRNPGRVAARYLVALVPLAATVAGARGARP